MDSPHENGSTVLDHVPQAPAKKTPPLGRLELPQDTLDDITALQRMRRDKTPHDVVAEGVELLRRTYADKGRRGAK